MRVPGTGRSWSRAQLAALGGCLLGALLSVLLPLRPVRRAESAVSPRAETTTKSMERAAAAAIPVEASVAVPPRATAASLAAKDSPVTAAAEPRVYAKTRFVWIREQPSWEKQWIGILFPGNSARLRSTKPVYAKGCGTWYAVLPRGYVCVDDKRATLDPQDPELAQLRPFLPELSVPGSRRYAESLGAERYDKLPDHREQRAREPDLAQHLMFVEAARGGAARDPSLAGIDLTPAPQDAVAFSSLPVDIQMQRNRLRHDSTLAYVGEFKHDGRSFLLTPDFTWVPKDRVRPFPDISFRGIHLNERVKLPIALFRERDRPAFRRTRDGAFEPLARTFPRLGSISLTDHSELSGSTRYIATVEDGVWVRESDAVVVRPAPSTPWGARMDRPDTSRLRPRGRATWIDASVYRGYLVAYEDTTPVFVTLFAPGRGGAKSSDSEQLVETSSTPLGRFPISGKFLTAWMDGPEGVTHGDVPWVQNFRGPHAIHGAYWHDAWGERVSGGCLNVSPEDARFLFEFTEPPLPEGWHGVRWDPHTDAATIVVVRP